MFNILEKKAEADRILYEDAHPEHGFILLPDLKWEQTQLKNLYVMAVSYKHGIKTLRDLNATHLPLLKNILKQGTVRNNQISGFSNVLYCTRESGDLSSHFHSRVSYGVTWGSRVCVEFYIFGELI